jgi:hypothetical protein
VVNKNLVKLLSESNIAENSLPLLMERAGVRRI